MEYAPLDRQTLSGIVGATPSGTAMQYCSSAFFTTPVDIGPLVTAVTDPDGPGPQSGVFVPCPSFDQRRQRCTRYDVPTTGLNTEEVKLGITALAATFFATGAQARIDGPHIARYVGRKWQSISPRGVNADRSSLPLGPPSNVPGSVRA